jgi:hypothetical protein
MVGWATGEMMNSEESAADGFIREASGPSGLVAVFEDDGETGYLYLYEPEGRGVLRDLHVYDRTSEVDVKEGDVQVEWSADQTKCGVRIWGLMRGIFNLASGQEGRVWLTSRNTPGVTDAAWLEGFAPHTDTPKGLR